MDIKDKNSQFSICIRPWVLNKKSKNNSVQEFCTHGAVICVIARYAVNFIELIYWYWNAKIRID